MTVVAVDDDPLDTAAPIYTLAGRVDQAKLSITSAGSLTFQAAPDYENFTDALLAGANRDLIARHLKSINLTKNLGSAVEVNPLLATYGIPA